MPDIDDRLQRYLSQIEAGVPKDKVLSSLKDGEQELAALIKLADAMRTISHPLPAPAYSRAARQKILAAAPQTRTVAIPAQNPLGWLVFPSLTGVVAILLVAFISLAAFGVWMVGPARAEMATVQSITGVVELAKTADSEDWTVLNNGDTLRSGQRIRTAPGSGATLVYADGSHSVLGPESTLLLSKLDGSWGGDIRIELAQSLGQTSYDVIPFRNQSAFFRINTPSGVVSVHGTSFKVFVEANGDARVVVDSGEVAVSNNEKQVLVPAGQVTILQPGKAPEEPGNFFDIVDVVSSIENTRWSITGQSFQVNAHTHIQGTPKVGDLLQIQGRILGNGLWVADLIQPLDENVLSSFTGVVEEKNPDSWRVSSKQILVNAVTQVSDQTNVGESVEVSYLALRDGRWLALQINPVGNTGQAVAEELPGSELATSVMATITPTVTTPLTVVSCDLGDQESAAQALAAKLGAPYEDIASWYCQGFSMDEIELAYNLSLQTNHAVSEIFGYRAENMEWEEIYALLMIQTSQAGASSKVCQRDGYSAKAQQLADKYDVSYDEVVDLYCQGYTFANIDLAYSLGKQYGKSASEIMQMYQQAKNWGQLKKELGDQAVKESNPNKPPTKEPNPNKPDKDKNNNSNNNGNSSSSGSDKEVKPTRDDT